MSTRQDGAAGAPVRTKDDLVAWIEAGCKPRTDWRIGTEHEKFVFRTGDLASVSYGGEGGILALMDALAERYGWRPVKEDGKTIALRRDEGTKGGSISLEPGGQFELSGAPLATLHETAEETEGHLCEVLSVGERLGVGFLGLGFTPKWRLEDIPRMPKRRYEIMTRYMPTVGARGLDMMYRTATIQVNLDFADEADMVKKLRVSLALQPIATALFAASPFTDGKPNGFKSARAAVWRETDPARTGALPWAFEDGMGFERYVDYALSTPMYFIYRDGRYVDAAGASFRDFLDAKLPQAPGERPTLDDWSDHLTTLFPDVRLKRFLEMRGADGGRWRSICALSAFWTGLLYDQTALDAAWDMVKDWTREDRDLLSAEVPRRALAAPIGNRTARDVAAECLAVARSGLRARANLNAASEDETRYLSFIEEIVLSGRTVADQLLDDYAGRWRENIDHIFEEYAF